MEKSKIDAAKVFSDQRFTKISMIRNKRSSAYMLNLLPGQNMKPHNHPERELYLYVITGNGMFSIEGEEIAAETGDVFYIDEHEQIGFTNTGSENVSIYVTMTKMVK